MHDFHLTQDHTLLILIELLLAFVNSFIINVSFQVTDLYGRTFLEGGYSVVTILRGLS